MIAPSSYFIVRNGKLTTAQGGRAILLTKNERDQFTRFCVAVCNRAKKSKDAEEIVRLKNRIMELEARDA